MSAEMPAQLWERACLAVALFALQPGGAGVVLRGPPGPVRDNWLEQLSALLPPKTPMRRVPAHIGDERLIGGIDIAATLRAGRPIAETGVLAQSDGGVIVLAMAERIGKSAAARLAGALDSGFVALERDGFSLKFASRIGLVMLDEGQGDDEPLPAALMDRARYVLDLTAIDHRVIADPTFTADDIVAARARLAGVRVDAQSIEALVGVASRLGVPSLRAPLFAVQAARALCALRGAEAVEEADLKIAASLVLAPRATQVPTAPSDEAEGEPEADEAPANADQDDTDQDEAKEDEAKSPKPESLDDIVLSAAQAAIPKNWLAEIESGRILRAKAKSDGKSGAFASSTLRGRPMEPRAGALREGRLSLIATIRAAAPWQRVRRTEQERRRVIVRPEDFRIVRFRQRRGSTAIFVVDASGSAAFQRLAEVKGAIELLLADCYIRRDSVALIAFRGKTAEIVLPPTRSTARAKRALAGLPGGGGTPIAIGIEAAAALADQVKRKGQNPLVVLMTDGRANIGRDGAPGRPQAMTDALNAGRRLRASGVAALAIDTAPPSPRAEAAPTLRIAEAMLARYVKLPILNASNVNEAVREAIAR